MTIKPVDRASLIKLIHRLPMRPDDPLREALAELEAASARKRILASWSRSASLARRTLDNEAGESDADKFHSAVTQDGFDLFVARLSFWEDHFWDLASAAHEVAGIALVHPERQIGRDEPKDLSQPIDVLFAVAARHRSSRQRAGRNADILHALGLGSEPCDNRRLVEVAVPQLGGLAKMIELLPSWTTRQANRLPAALDEPPIADAPRPTARAGRNSNAARGKTARTHSQSHTVTASRRGRKRGVR